MTLYHIKRDGNKTEVSPGNNPRLSFSFNSINYRIILQKVHRMDGGTYIMSAINHFGVETQVFRVSIIGECVVSRECVGEK